MQSFHMQVYHENYNLQSQILMIQYHLNHKLFYLFLNGTPNA